MNTKKYQEKGNPGGIFVADRKPLSPTSSKMICEKCRQLVSAGLLSRFECLSSSDNTQDRLCILREMEFRNQFRQVYGGRSLSHIQVDAAMQGILAGIGFVNDNFQHHA